MFGFIVKFLGREDGNAHRPKAAYWEAVHEESGKKFDIAAWQGRAGYHVLGIQDARHELADKAIRAVRAHSVENP